LKPKGQSAVTEYCFEELFGKKIEVEADPEPEPNSRETVFPGAEEIKIDGDPFESKELSKSPSRYHFSLSTSF
jgi:hypothetical protein